MSVFRFSPINDKPTLLEAIRYIHFESFRLCMQNLGYILPVSGNIGVFCHFEKEYKLLTQIKEELTDSSRNWNNKYFHLHNPITIPAKNDIPETTYTHLYIRKPDESHPHVGDVDFYLEPAKYKRLKGLLLSGKQMKGVRIFERLDLDLIRMFDVKSDVSAFVGSYLMSKVVR